MTFVKFINILFFAVGIASGLYLVISIILRNIRKSFEDMKIDLLKELKDKNRRNKHHASVR